MVGWHHRLRHEFEQAPRVGNGQGRLACCSPWGHKESGTTLSNPMDCSPRGSSILGIFQARVLDRGAIAFSKIPYYSILFIFVGSFKKNMKVLVTQQCLTLGDPMDCSLPGSSVHGILQARILKWVGIPFSRGSSQPRDQTQVSCIAGRFFIFEPPGKPLITNTLLLQSAYV